MPSAPVAVFSESRVELIAESLDKLDDAKLAEVVWMTLQHAHSMVPDDDPNFVGLHNTITLARCGLTEAAGRGLSCDVWAEGLKNMLGDDLAADRHLSLVWSATDHREEGDDA